MIRRPYTHRDLIELQTVFEGWIAVAGRCGYDHSGELPHRIYENLRGRRPVGDLVHIWSDGPDVAALSICLRFGCAFDVFVAPGRRGGAFEQEVIEDAYDTTARIMGERPEAEGMEYVYTDVFSRDHHRIAALDASGFERFRSWDEVRERKLDDSIRSTVDGPLDGPTVDGFTIRPATLEDADELARARNAAFDLTDPDERWTGEQYRSAVMRRPGYDPSREIVAVAADGRVAAYTVFWVDQRNGLGHFEPVGTHRDFRRRGLAAALMRHAMATMRANGLTSVSVNHNADNVAARRLYESLGFAVTDETYGYRRRVDREWRPVTGPG